MLLKVLAVHPHQIVRDQILCRIWISPLVKMERAHKAIQQMTTPFIKGASKSFKLFSCQIWGGPGSRQRLLLVPASMVLDCYHGLEVILQHRQSPGYLYSHFRNKTE